MTLVQKLAQFVVDASFEDLSEKAKRQLKIRILDSLGCAIGALDAEPTRMLRVQLEDFGGRKHSTLIGGGSTAPDLASLYNSALVRYLDFNDSYLAKGESCHPSDNLGAVLASSEYAKGRGKDLLVSLAVAYQIQCRLSDVAPVRSRGFDHTTQSLCGCIRSLQGASTGRQQDGQCHSHQRYCLERLTGNTHGEPFPLERICLSIHCLLCDSIHLHGHAGNNWPLGGL